MVGGVETHLDDLCNFFNKQKYTAFIRTYKAFGVKQRGIEIEKTGYINIHRLWWPDFGLIFKLESYPVLKFLYFFLGLFIDCLLFLSKKHKSIDVIQAHGFIAGLIAVILGKVFDKRVVVNTHVGFKLKGGVMTNIIKWTLLNCGQVLVLTTGIKTALINLGVPENKIEIYHYWVDQKKFNVQKNAKKKLGWENKFVVLYIGRLIEVKGVKMIFDLARSLQDITFAIIGLGPLTDELKQKTKRYPNVIFLGKIGNNKLPIYYSGADLLLIPSRIIEQEYEEGIPRVMIEALYCGLPIISTKSGGVPEMLNEKVGRLTDDEFVSIREAAENLYKDRRLLKSISKNCRMYALNLFSIKNAKIIESSLIKKSF